MREVIIALISNATLIIVGYISYRGVKYAKKGSEKVNYELSDNSGKSALDKIRNTIREETSKQSEIFDRRFDHITTRLEHFERREMSNSERLDGMDQRDSHRRDKITSLQETIVRMQETINTLRKEP
jgi:predicted  nucleic acid-binding Zn-ribbon protein